MFADLMRKKSLDEILAAPEEGHGQGLKRNLSAFSLTMLGIGAVIGAGIFTSVGTAAAGGAARLDLGRVPRRRARAAAGRAGRAGRRGVPGVRAVRRRALAVGHRLDLARGIVPRLEPVEDAEGALSRDDDVQAPVLEALGDLGDVGDAADPVRAVVVGNEPVTIAGDVVGRVTSGGYGATVDASIAYAYLPAGMAEPGTAVEVGIFGRWVSGEVRAEPLFDPAGERIRG